jgi:hypothetical protein
LKGGNGSSVPLARGAVVPPPFWALDDSDGAASAPPSDGGKPGPRGRDRARVARRGWRVAPPAEPRPQAARVDPGRRAQVLPEVQKDVDEPAPRLRGRAEWMPVIAAAPHASAPPRRAVDRLRAARRQSLQPADERQRMVAFDEKMDVIALHGEVDDAKGRLVVGRERAAQDWKDARRPQRGKRVAGPQRDVHGPARLMSRAWPMRRARSRRDELPARARPLATPPPSRRQLELSLTPPSHASVLGAARAALRPDRNIAQSRWNLHCLAALRSPALADQTEPTTSRHAILIEQSLPGARGSRARRRSSRGGWPDQVEERARSLSTSTGGRVYVGLWALPATWRATRTEMLGERASDLPAPAAPTTAAFAGECTTPSSSI